MALAPENHLHPTEPKWFAVYTNYKREKIVRKRLEESGIEVYLPIQKVTRLYVRKKKVVELPLISCYIFVKITKEQYVTVLATEHVINFVRFSKNLISIPDAEIEVIKRVLGTNLEMSVEKTLFSKGDTVEIASGPLVGLRGRLVDNQRKKEVLIELERLGYSMRVSVNPVLLNRVGALV